MAEGEDLLESAVMEGEEAEVAAEGAELAEGDAQPVKPRVQLTLRNIPELVGERFFRLIVVGAAAILLTVAVSWWFSQGSAGEDSSSAVAQTSQAGKAKAKKGHGRVEPQPPPEPPVVSPTEKAERIAGYFAQGEAALARRDYQAAIVAFDEIARIDPENVAVRGKILAAGEEYKKYRADAEKLEKAKELFAEGEYQSALRMIYRLPEGMLQPDLWERYKVAGWYNLGLVALRGANCTEAIAHLNEARSLAPADPEVKAARELADRCRAQSSDRSFYNRADSLPFRALDPPAPKPAISAGSGAGR